MACRVGHYKSYHYGEETSVLEVFKDKIKLENDLTENGTCWYLAENWSLVEPVKQVRQKEAQLVGFAKTQYFAVKLDTSKESLFLEMDIQTTPNNANYIPQTILADSKREVLEHVKSSIKKGEKWVILQTVSLIEPEEPKIPLKITELR